MDGLPVDRLGCVATPKHLQASSESALGALSRPLACLLSVESICRSSSDCPNSLHDKVRGRRSPNFLPFAFCVLSSPPPRIFRRHKPSLHRQPLSLLLLIIKNSLLAIHCLRCVIFNCTVRAPHMLLCIVHPATFPPAFFHSSARPILNPPIYFLSNPQHRAIILLTLLNHTDISTSYRRSVDLLKKYNALLIAPRRQWCRRTCFRADWYHHQLHHLLRGRAYICGP